MDDRAGLRCQARFDGLYDRGGADVAERVGREVAHVVPLSESAVSSDVSTSAGNDAQGQRGLLASCSIRRRLPSERMSHDALLSATRPITLARTPGNAGLRVGQKVAPNALWRAKIR
jgi:hypothetical protein